MRGAKPVALALQGGGAHGAFCWGVLDALLEDGRLHVKAATGASAGAMNAVVCAAGMLKNGAEGARAGLESFWRGVARAGARFNPAQGASAAGLAILDAFSRLTSPYDRNPFNFHPLRELLTSHVDFAALRDHAPFSLYVAATNVGTGRARIFRERELTAEMVLASACLPHLFHAVEIGGERYWDGGYLANPPLFPLLGKDTPPDIVLVPLLPVERHPAPLAADEIMSRLNEITFNGPLLSELRAIALGRRHAPRGPLGRRIRTVFDAVRFHAIRDEAMLADLPTSSKVNTEWRTLVDLKERGRRAAQDWLETHWRDIGQRESLDIDAETLSQEMG